MPRLIALLALAGSVLASSRPAFADAAEDKAVALVKKLGGDVTRDDKQPGKPVTKVFLFGSPVTDAVAKELAAFKSLTTLGLGGTQVTDAGARELQKALPKCKISN
jgi:hypothetical protein